MVNYDAGSVESRVQFSVSPIEVKKIIKAIIFDVDDTLIDFSAISTSLIQEVAKESKVRIPTKKEIDTYWGIPLRETIKKMGIKLSFYKFWKILLKKYLKHRKDFKSFPGTNETLKKLKEKYILGALTSKQRFIMNLQFKDTKIPSKYFKFKLSANDTKYHKPDPRVFSKVFKKLKKLEKDEILYVGDTIHDCISSKKAGIKFVAVLTGHYGNKDFRKCGLENKNIIKSVKDLPKWLEKNDMHIL